MQISPFPALAVSLAFRDRVQQMRGGRLVLALPVAVRSGIVPRRLYIRQNAHVVA